MALYDGFFNAMLDESTSEYDRLYDAGDMTEYYAHMIGSGVCVYGNANSFKVSYSNRVATVAPGYLFIRGYWLKSDADYTINMPASGTYVILAQLNITARTITLTYAAPAVSYNDALCLANINIDTGVCTDTRGDVDICPLVDTAANMSSKASYAKSYIDSEVDSRLNEIEAQIRTQVSALDDKIDEVQSIADAIGYPAVGEIKYSAATMSNKWLRCNGAYISASSYPALVAVLGQYSIASSISQLTGISISNVKISNFQIYDSRIWVFCWNDKKLYYRHLTSGAAGSVDISAYTSMFMEPNANYRMELCIASGKLIIFGHELTSTSVILPIGRSYTISGTTVTYEAALRNYSNGSYTTSAQPFIRSRAVITGGKYYYATLQAASSNYYVGYTVATPVSGGTPTYTYAISPPFMYSSGGTGVTPLMSFNPKNQDLLYAQGGYNSSTQKTIAMLRTVLNTVSTDAFYTSTDTASFIGNVYKRNILIVASSAYAIYGIEYNDSYLCILSINIGDQKPYIAKLSRSSLPTAYVFEDSVVFAAGYFFIFLGSYLLVTDDPTDASHYNYVDLSAVITPITSYGDIEYDSANNCLIIAGITAAGGIVIYKVSLTNWQASSSGAYLPNTSKGAIPGYIKAVAG